MVVGKISAKRVNGIRMKRIAKKKTKRTRLRVKVGTLWGSSKRKKIYTTERRKYSVQTPRNGFPFAGVTVNE